MKAVVFTSSEAWTSCSWRTWTIRSPGPARSSLDVTASALNHLDVDVREGDLPLPDRAPAHPRRRGRRPRRGGRRRASRAGSRATARWSFIMDVCRDCRYCRTGRESLCLGPGFISFSTGGGYAEKIAVPARHLVRDPGRRPRRGGGGAPDRVRDVLAHALHARPAAGRRDGPRSTRSAAASARRPCSSRSIAGAFVIGNAELDEKLERARELGMDVGINHATQDVVEEVHAGSRTAQGVDLAYEHVGGELFQKGLDSLGKDGRLVICGGHAGEVVPFDIIPFFRAQKSIIGSFVYTPRRGRALLRARGARRDQAARAHDVPARRGERGDGDDGAPRALRQDRPHARRRSQR